MRRRTTLRIDDDVLRETREIAKREGRTFTDVLNEAVRAGLENDPVGRELLRNAR